MNILPLRLTALYLHYTELTDLEGSLPFVSLVILDAAHCHSFGSSSFATVNKLSNLRVMNLQNTSMTSLHDMLFINLLRVEQFNILNNAIPILHDYAFLGLNKIVDLDLHALAIIFIYQNAFYGLTSVQTLNLSKNRLTVLSMNIFSSLDSIVSLDISDNPLTSIRIGSFVAFHSPVRMSTTRMIECQCYMEELNIDCHATVISKYTNCKPLLPSTFIVVVYLSSVVYILLCSAFHICLQLRFATPNAQLPLTLALAIHDMLSGVLLIFPITVHLLYTDDYPLSRQLIDDWKICKVVSVLLILIQVISKQIIVLMSCVHMYVTGIKVITTPYPIKKIITEMMLSWIGCIAVSALWTTYTISYPASPCVPFGVTVFSKSYISWIVIASYTFVSVALVVIAFVIDTITVKRIKESQKVLGAGNQMSVIVKKTFLRRYLLASISYILELTIVFYPMFSANVNVYVYTLLLSMSVLYKTTSHIVSYSDKYITLEVI